MLTDLYNSLKRLQFSFVLLVLFFIVGDIKLIGDDIVPPVYSVEKKEFEGGVVEKISFRPFFTVYRTVDGSKKKFEQLQALWPFIFYQKTDERRKFRFWPFAFVNEVNREDGVDKDTAIFPILFFGSDPKEGRYFGFFPLGGRVKGLFGKEKIDWFLFPLFSRSIYKDFVSTHILFPFFNYSNGPRRHGFRFWPFWGRYKIFKEEDKKELLEDRRFYFWPFWVKQTRYYPDGKLGKSFLSFPFYAKYDSPSKKEVSYLWPIYKRTEYPKTNELYYTILWPFVKWGSGDHIVLRDIWPFFGYKKNADFKRYYFLWPFVRYEKLDNKESKYGRFWFLPFYWRYKYHDKLTGKKRDFMKVWPIFDYSKNNDGRKRVRILSLFWFKDSVKGGFENNYAPFFNIWNLEYQKGKWYELKALFHLIHLKKSEEERKISLLGFLFNYHRKAEEKKVSFLGGMLEYRKKDGYRRYKFLWIPFSRKIKSKP